MTDPWHLIGIAGPLRAGKDTIAGVLVRRYGFTRLAFADQLKAEVAARLPRTLKAILSDYDLTRPPSDEGLRWSPDHDGDPVWWRLRLAEAFATKQPLAIRALLQEWGTDLRRAEQGDYWLRAWLTEADRQGARAYVVPDVRFGNEAHFIREWGGLLVRVDRPGFGGDSHLSERDLDDWREWDAHFINDGPREALEAAVSAWWEGRR